MWHENLNQAYDKCFAKLLLCEKPWEEQEGFPCETVAFGQDVLVAQDKVLAAGNLLLKDTHFSPVHYKHPFRAHPFP